MAEFSKENNRVKRENLGRTQGSTTKKETAGSSRQKNRTRYLQGGAILPERYRNRFMKKMIWDL